MKKVLIFVVLAYITVIHQTSMAQMMKDGMMGGHGMMGDHGMMGGTEVSIPEQLPKPKNYEWVAKIREILLLEENSKKQYQHDSGKYHAHMPYMMIEPQEENHINWISQLIHAYRLEATGSIPPVKESSSLTEAYNIGKEIEADLIPRYEWLVKSSEDETSASVLDMILLQTRMHFTMFEHALRMGGMMMR